MADFVGEIRVMTEEDWALYLTLAARYPVMYCAGCNKAYPEATPHVCECGSRTFQNENSILTSTTMGRAEWLKKMGLTE